VLLSELTASVRRLALVGLAKNTGKTETLAALLRELEADGRRVGVTSVGRDGEERDAIDARIEKPRVRLAPGSLVATTDGLLRASTLEHEVVEETSVRTPLGRVLVARLDGGGQIEVAGPSAVGDVRVVSETMLAHGAEQVLIDGAVDRRAASSPEVSDGLVMATGAVLDRNIEHVVARTADAVALVRLALIEDGSRTGWLQRELAAFRGADASMLVGEDQPPVRLPPRFVLSAEAEPLARLLDEHPSARYLLVGGALPDRFLESLLVPLHRRGRELVLVVADPTRVFLANRSLEWYARQGVHLRATERIALEALTVNPVAPQSHHFDSGELRGRLVEAIPEIPIFDVMHPDYRTACRSPGQGAVRA
jgi:hypothetical protein